MAPRRALVSSAATRAATAGALAQGAVVAGGPDGGASAGTVAPPAARPSPPGRGAGRAAGSMRPTPPSGRRRPPPRPSESGSSAWAPSPPGGGNEIAPRVSATHDANASGTAGSIDTEAATTRPSGPTSKRICGRTRGSRGRAPSVPAGAVPAGASPATAAPPRNARNPPACRTHSRSSPRCCCSVKTSCSGVSVGARAPSGASWIRARRCSGSGASGAPTAPVPVDSVREPPARCPDDAPVKSKKSSSSSRGPSASSRPVDSSRVSRPFIHTAPPTAAIIPAIASAATNTRGRIPLCFSGVTLTARA